MFLSGLDEIPILSARTAGTGPVPVPMHYVFRPIVAVLSFRIKLCSVDFLVHFSTLYYTVLHCGTLYYTVKHSTVQRSAVML